MKILYNCTFVLSLAPLKFFAHNVQPVEDAEMRQWQEKCMTVYIPYIYCIAPAVHCNNCFVFHCNNYAIDVINYAIDAINVNPFLWLKIVHYYIV